MAKNPSRILVFGATTSRNICTEVAMVTEPAPATETGPEMETPPALETGKGKEDILYRRLSALGGSSEGSIKKALNKWVMEGKSVKKFEMEHIIRELRKYKRFTHALELSEWMETRGINLSYRDYAVRTDLLARAKGIAEAEKYFDGLSQAAKNQLTYGALLNCYCREKNAEKAFILFAKMKELNFASTTLVYNNLLTLFVKLDQPEKVPTLVEEMKSKNIAPDLFTYNILMNSFASLKDYESVEKVIDEIKEGGKVKCDWTTYSNLAAVYVAAGLFEKADLALKELEKNINLRDRQAFHFLISLYAGTSNLAEVKRTWQSLKSAFPRTTNLSYLVMLQALSKLDDFEGLKDIFEEWESCYSTYDIRLTNVLINAYIRKGMIKEAESLSESTISKGSGPNFRTLEMFMDYYLKNHQMDSALKNWGLAISGVKGKDWQPNQEKVRGFLKYFEEESDVDGGEEFCRKLKTVKSVDSEVYEFLLRTYIAAGKLEPLMRQRIKEDGIEISSDAKRLLDRVCPE